MERSACSDVGARELRRARSLGRAAFVLCDPVPKFPPKGRVDLRIGR